MFKLFVFACILACAAAVAVVSPYGYSAYSTPYAYSGYPYAYSGYAASTYGAYPYAYGHGLGYRFY